MNFKKYGSLLILAFLGVHCVSMQAQEKRFFTPKIQGTLRGKYEFQPQERKGRFEVRNARVSVEGQVSEKIYYKAQIDLSDEGRIRMLDAYTRIQPTSKLNFRIGQMRVPFSIDAHRSPHEQYFANRSFIAKQVGNVRDVGATIGYTLHLGFPIKMEAGFFNGSGLTNQKDYWTHSLNYSAKVQFLLPQSFDVVLSTQKVKPDAVAIYMYDIGITYHHKSFRAEAEYLYKHYADEAFQSVHSVNAFVNYDIPLRNCFFSKISPLIRYDFLTNHSDGKRYLDGIEDKAGALKINDYQRSRLTSGITLSIDKPFISDIRINYEKYFYRQDAIIKISDKDKFVIEVMTRF